MEMFIPFDRPQSLYSSSFFSRCVVCCLFFFSALSQTHSPQCFFTKKMNRNRTTILDLSNSKLRGERGATTIINSLSKHDNTLLLRSSGLDLEAVTILAKNLSSRSSLQFLDLSYNKLKDEGVKELSRNLPENLKELILNGCEIGDEGCKSLVSNLSRNCDVSRLSLCGNMITSQGALYFASMIESTNLRRLDLSRNIIEREGVDALMSCSSQRFEIVGFRDWFDAVSKEREALWKEKRKLSKQRRRMREMLLRNQEKNLETAFTTWKVMCNRIREADGRRKLEAKRIRRECSTNTLHRVCRRIVFGATRSAFDMWRRYMWQCRLNSVETQWRERLRAEREQHEAQIRELRGKLETSSNESNTRTVKRLLRRWKHRYLSSAFKTWNDVVRQDSLEREQLESSTFRIVVALKKMHHNKIFRAWQTWRSYTLMCRQKLDSSSELRGHAARSVFRSLKRWRVRGVLECWREFQ